MTSYHGNCPLLIPVGDFSKGSFSCHRYMVGVLPPDIWLSSTHEVQSFLIFAISAFFCGRNDSESTADNADLRRWYEGKTRFESEAISSLFSEPPESALRSWVLALESANICVICG